MLKKYEQIPQAFSNYLSVELDKLLEWTHVVQKNGNGSGPTIEPCIWGPT